MPTKIEDLVQKKDEIRASLDELSKVVWTQEKETLQKSITKKLDDLKKWIDNFTASNEAEKWKISDLKSDVDKISSDFEKFKEELKALKQWVMSNNNVSESGSEQTESDKWIREKTKDYVWEQWGDVTSWEKWKEEPWKNILRAVGFWVTGYALYKWAKKLWNWAFWDKEDEEDEEDEETEEKPKKKKKKKKSDKSFWDSTAWQILKTTWTILWVWTWVYYLAHWIYTKNWWLNDLWDWEKGKKLDFDTALHVAEWAISNQDNKEWMSYGLDLKYHEDTSEIEAYWIRVKIDKDKRKIVWKWMDNVSFNKYEHMISTAILIAYLKKNYSWKCKNNAPFSYSWGWSGNIDVNGSEGSNTAADWTWSGWRIVWVSAAWIAWIATGIFGGLQTWAAVWVVWGVVWWALGYAYDTNNILHQHMPEIDNEFWMNSLCAYLNSMKCWQERNESEEDITESPIKDEVWKCVKKIQDENPDLPAEWWRRAFDAVPDPEHPGRYTIKAYWREIYAEVKDGEVFENIPTLSQTVKDSMQKLWGSTKKMKVLWISGWNPEIKADMSEWNIWDIELPLQEWLYMTALIGQLLDKYHHKWNEYPRFEYTWRVADEVLSWFWLWWDARGLFFSDSRVDTLAISREKFEKNMPTLSRDEYNERFLKFLNWIKDEQNVSIWKKKE